MLHRNIFDCLPQRGLPGRNRSDYEELLYIEILRHSRAFGRTVSRYFHGADIPRKKKLFYTEYFQAKIYQITRAFV